MRSNGIRGPDGTAFPGTWGAHRGSHDDGSPAFDGAALSGKKRACLRLPWE